MPLRADMIGPVRLKSNCLEGNTPISQMMNEHSPLVNFVLPGVSQGQVNGVLPPLCCPASPKPIQPALVIVQKSMEETHLEKAFRAHVDFLHKAEPALAESSENPSTFPGSSQGGIDVSTPQHEHARLKAKQTYLSEKLQAHKNAGHDTSHPMVQQRTRALGSVNKKIQSMENQGIKSTGVHHDDWIDHYQQNPHKYSEAHINAGLSSHLANMKQHSLETPSEKQVASQATRGTSLSTNPIAVTPKSDIHSELFADPKLEKQVINRRKEMGIDDVTGFESPRASLRASSPKPSLKNESKSAKVPSEWMKKWQSYETPQPEIRMGNKKVSNPKITEGRTYVGPSYSKEKYTAKSLIDSMIDISKAKDKKSDDWIGEKIRILMNEGKPQKQAIAIAYSMAGRSKKVKKSITGLFVAV